MSSGDDYETMERPTRWKVSYADEMVDSVMGDEEVRELMGGALEKLAQDGERFPADLPLEGIVRHDTRIRTYQKGEVVIGDGEYGNSAFYILGGRVHVLLEKLSMPSRSQRAGSRASKLLRSVARLFQRKSSQVETRRALRKPSAEKAHGQIIHLRDFPEFLLKVPGGEGEPDPKMVVTLPAGEAEQAGMIFGEIAALSRIPRTATVLAATDGTRLLEIRWQGLRDIRKFSPRWKEMIDESYRKSSLLSHLRHTRYTRNLYRRSPSGGNAAELKQAEGDFAEVARHTKFWSFGEVSWNAVFKQMATADERQRQESEPIILQQGAITGELILVRSGFVRVSRRYNHGERTVAYLGKGQTYGMVELYHNAHLDQGRFGSDRMTYQHTLRAVGRADVLAVPAPVVQKLVLPKLDCHEVEELEEEAGRLLKGEDASGRGSSPLMEFFVRERAINGTAAMFIDLERCTRCDDCVRACAATHENNPRFIRSGVQEQGIQLTHACMHCTDPVCMIGCPTGAIHRDAVGNQVVINEYTCIGCSTCADNCPYDNIQMVDLRDVSGDLLPGTWDDPERGRVRDFPSEPPLRKATKCDLCESLPIGPACVNACPHDALIRADMTKPETLYRWLDR